MKFHEYKTFGEEMRSRFPRHVSEEKFYAVAMAGGVRTGNGLIRTVLLFSCFSVLSQSPYL